MLKRLIVLSVSLAVFALDQACAVLRRLLGRPAPPQGTVLYYHAVKQYERRRFARQLDDFLRLARPFDAGSPGSMVGGGRQAAVTFDDGFRSVIENALPELAARGIPFTMFVPSGSMGLPPGWVREGHPFRDERVMSAGELAEFCRNPLATVGSHGVSHRNLLRIGAAEAEKELLDSRSALEAVVGAPVELFSFPHGGHDAALIDAARRAGYRRVFTIEPRPVGADASVVAVGRVAVNPWDWRVEFLLKVAGAYRWRRHKVCDERF